MNVQEVKEFIQRDTCLNVNINCDDNGTQLTQTNLRQVLEMFHVWSSYIDTELAKETFLSTLLNDLIHLGCCAVSGHPNSPCYIGKQANLIPSSPISIHKYTRCSIDSNEVKYELPRNLTRFF